MEVVSIMRQEQKEDTSVTWVDLAILAIVYIFAREGSPKRAFLELDPSSNWGISIPKEDKKVFSEYNGCVIVFMGVPFRF